MQNSAYDHEHRAEAPQLPELTRGVERRREEFEVYRAERETAERRSMVRALMLIAVVALVGSVAHAGMARVFVQGWWRP